MFGAARYVLRIDPSDNWPEWEIYLEPDGCVAYIDLEGSAGSLVAETRTFAALLVEMVRLWHERLLMLFDEKTLLELVERQRWRIENRDVFESAGSKNVEIDVPFRWRLGK
jgi:hypothetical protein